MATLRRPTYTAADLGYGPLRPDAMLSPRVAPQMIGLGLLEAVPAADILARADPDDADGDGISGRPQIVWSDDPRAADAGPLRAARPAAPTIREQTASAFAGDIGISTPLLPAGSGDCTDAQTDCRAAPDGGDAGQGGFEIDARGLDLVTFYSRNLAVPARRDVDDPQVLRGQASCSTSAGCTACHTPELRHPPAASDQPEQSFQLIWPYTDLLLHDMGEGLADHRPEGRATRPRMAHGAAVGYRTDRDRSSGHTYFLHDGRARSLLEAVLWHGGEAGAARDAVVDMPAEDRAALIRFLESL